MGFDGRETPMITSTRYSSPSFSIVRYFSLFMKLSYNVYRRDEYKGIVGIGEARD